MRNQIEPANHINTQPSFINPKLLWTNDPKLAAKWIERLVGWLAEIGPLKE